MINKFRKIEIKYPVETIRYKGDQVWSFLRNNYFSKTIEDKTKIYSISKQQTFWGLVFLKLKQSFYGFKNWFGKYDYIFFSDSQERILYKEKYIDKSLEKIMGTYGYDSCLMIEEPVSSHYPIEKIATKHIVSRSLLSLFVGIFTRVVFALKYETIRIDILDNINTNENLQIDYSSIILKFRLRKYFFKIFFRIYQPKVVYFNCYYTKQEIVLAANELGIKTIEVQHGIIGKRHYAYNLNKKLDKVFYPQYLLTYGRYEQDILLHNTTNPFKMVFPIGSYGLEVIKEKEISKDLYILTNRYKKSVSVSTQYTVEDKLAKFIIEVALKNRDIGFFFSLRHFDKEYYKKFQMPKNIHLFYNEYTCYDILKVCDVHCTVYSTCGLEAIFFDKLSIFIDIENLATQFIEKKVSKNIYIIDNIYEFKDIMDKNFIDEKLSFYKKDYTNNIKFIIKEIGE